MKISLIEQAHLTQCAGLFVQVFNAAPWNEDWNEAAVVARLQECFGTPGFFGLIIEREEETVGFALGYKERWAQETHFYLKEICVLTEHQRAGVGTQLMNELEAQLKAQGVAKLYLYTARETPAETFYKKQGFYTSSKMIMMAKWLTPKTESP